MELTFEQGSSRQPSEARSLLIRVTRNCPWNRCAFCYTYQGCRFELRSVEDVKRDIQVARDIAEQIKDLPWKMEEGSGGRGSIGDWMISPTRTFGGALRSS